MVFTLIFILYSCSEILMVCIRIYLSVLRFFEHSRGFWELKEKPSFVLHSIAIEKTINTKSTISICPLCIRYWIRICTYFTMQRRRKSYSFGVDFFRLHTVWSVNDGESGNLLGTRQGSWETEKNF